MNLFPYTHVFTYEKRKSSTSQRVRWVKKYCWTLMGKYRRTSTDPSSAISSVVCFGVCCYGCECSSSQRLDVMWNVFIVPQLQHSFIHSAFILSVGREDSDKMLVAFGLTPALISPPPPPLSGLGRVWWDLSKCCYQSVPSWPLHAPPRLPYWSLLLLGTSWLRTNRGVQPRLKLSICFLL